MGGPIAVGIDFHLHVEVHVLSVVGERKGHTSPCEVELHGDNDI
jgi:hypothetical protein